MIKTDLGSECARPIAKCDNVINTYCRTSNSCPFCPNNERCIVGLVCRGSQKTCVATAHNSQFCVRRKNGFVLNFFLYLMNWLRNKFGDKLPARPQSWSDVSGNRPHPTIIIFSLKYFLFRKLIPIFAPYNKLNEEKF